jgi:hypothetical protein
MEQPHGMDWMLMKEGTCCNAMHFECAGSEISLIVSRPLAEGSGDTRPSAAIGSGFYRAY